MTIILKNKHTLLYDEFEFKCCTGRMGLTKNKIEGDKKTPKGIFSLDKLYYRRDKVNKPITKLDCIPINKKMGWCNDEKNLRKYNKLIPISNKIRHEKLYRNDYKYDYLIPIKYNWNKPNLSKGSAIFIHLSKKYKPTAGCIGLKEKDFLILIKLINKKSKIKIY